MSYGSKIEYYLRQHLTNKDKYMAQTVRKSVVDTDRLVARIRCRYTRYSEIELQFMIAIIREEIELCISGGESVRIEGLFTMRPTVTGTFDSWNEGFNRSKHKLKLPMTADRKLVTMLNDKVGVQKVHRALKRKLPEDWGPDMVPIELGPREER